MSIFSELERIKAAKSAIRSAVNARGGNLSENQRLDDYAAAVTALPAGGESIDLSFVTAVSGDILAGKVGADVNGNPVYGNLQTVTATLTDNVVTVPKGNIAEAQTLTVAEMAEPSVSANVVTIPVGYNKAQKTVTIAEAAEALIDGSSVTVFPGFVKNQYTVELDVPDLSFITAQAEHIAPGYIGADKDGRQVEGSMPLATYVMVPGDQTDGIKISKGYLAEELEFEWTVGSSMEFYKCASVDTSAKTWTGYKAVLTDGVYSFEETLTTGLSYSAVEPEVGKVYSADALIEVKKLFDGSDPHLLCYFSMDDTGKAVDKVNGIELSASGNASGGVSGVIGNCWQASDGGYLSGSNIAFALPKVFTFNLLVNFSSSGGEAVIFEFGSYSSNAGYGFYSRSDGAVSWRVGNSGWSSYSSSTLPADEWAMLTVTCDGSSRTLYINGVSENTYSVNTVVNATSIGAFSRAGTEGSGASMNGKIDEVQLWDYAMTADEVTALYNKLMGGN